MVAHYFLRHLQAAVNSLGQFSRAPFTSLMTCLIIGITLALPSALFVAIKNMESVTGNLQQTTQITLYLKKNISQKNIDALIAELHTNPKIRSINAISPEQGLQELQQQAGFTELKGALGELQDNPLPWALVILPRTTEELNELSQSLQKLPQIDSLQLDMLWAQRLASLMALAQQVAYILAGFLGMAVLILVNHSIRASTQQNQKEIKIIKLMGGTHAFIRRPFIYAGMLYGLLGGIIAWLLIDTLFLLLKKPILQLANLYNTPIELFGMGIHNTLILLGSSILLGLIGSWLAVAYHLRNS